MPKRYSEVKIKRPKMKLSFVLSFKKCLKTNTKRLDVSYISNHYSLLVLKKKKVKAMLTIVKTQVILEVSMKEFSKKVKLKSRKKMLQSEGF